MHTVHSTDIRVTPAVAQLMKDGLDIGPYIHRHLNGDRGDISEAERARNRESPERNSGHVMSVWHVTGHITLWISTRDGITVIMLPLA